MLKFLRKNDRPGALELVVWDKDMLKKEYLGEAGVPLDKWFGDEQERALAFDDSRNTVRSFY